MCGIIGFIGKNRDCLNDLIYGLKRMEYRGYDSSGVAILCKNGISVVKKAGKINELEKALKKEKNFKSNIGIAHTRWATHGLANEVNAHPHYTDKVAIVHNGIIENYEELKSENCLKKCKFKSNTDSEVIAHLITYFVNKGQSPREAIQSTIQKLKGSYAIAIMFANDKDTLYCIRDGSPLAIGVGKEEMYLGSDAIALADLTKDICYLEEGDMAILKANSFQVVDVNNKEVSRKIQTVELDDFENMDKYDSYMEKEICEQPKVFHNTLASIEEAKKNLKLKNIKSIVIVACGTSYHAGCIAKNVLNSISNDIRINVEIASEFKYSHPILDKSTLAIFISQSGETADTLSALRYCKKRKIKTLAISNVPESSITRIADSTIYTCAGAEIGVASTKAFTTQVLVLSFLMNYIVNKSTKIFDELKEIPTLASEVLKSSKKIEKIATKYKNIHNSLYIGRGSGYSLALEGALKLKEISYVDAHAYPAGEMKHGPIALVDDKMPTIAVAEDNELFSKTISNIKEIQARKGKIILITNKDKKDLDFISKNDDVIILPKCSSVEFNVIAAIPLQMLAYNIAKLKGKDVDKPRNLAKSVTVE